MQTLRTRPTLAILLAILALLLLTGVAYAIGHTLGYLPGIGFVQPGAIRILETPVSQTRQGATITIEEVVADSERTVIVYKTEGLSLAAANSKGEGGPFGSEDLLRLPDGTTLKPVQDLGYNGTPEPLINTLQTEGGWPNYVWRLVYPPLPAQVNELTLVIPILQTMPPGAAPENWEVTFQVKSAPPEMTFAPMTVLPTINLTNAATAENPGPTSSNVSMKNGFTFQLDNVLELQDGFVFTGSLSWDDSAFPTGKGMIAEAVIPTLTDSSGEQIPLEEVQVNAPSEEHKTSWSYRTNRKAFTGRLTLSISSIKTSIAAPLTDFQFDFGSNPKIGQKWEVNRDFTVEGHTIRLLSVSLGPVPDTCQGVGILFEFKGDVPGSFAYIQDTLPQAPMVCTNEHGGGGGGGGPFDPTIFYSGISSKDIPTGVHHYAISFWVPGSVNGPWQVTWNAPFTSAPTPTAEPGACLTREKWEQLVGNHDALPSGVGGKIVTTVNEGGLLPAIYVTTLENMSLQKIAIGGWPSLSRDGTHLAYSASDGLRVVDLSTGQTVAFGVDGYRIIWSPDNTHMMFTNTFNLYVVNADGSGLQRVDTGAAQVIAPVGWLSDNQTILYSTLTGDGFDLKSHNLQSGETKDLFKIHNKAGYGSISPDGQWIVFADRVFGATNWSIFISRIDGSERRLIADPEVPTAFTSIWGPDGKWLILNTLNADGTEAPVLVNPFTCQSVHLDSVHGSVEDWSQ